MTTPDRQTRADRMAQPTTRDAVRAVAENHGACLRPVQLRCTNTHTGEIDLVVILAAPPLRTSARRARNAPSNCAPRSAGKAGTWTRSPSRLRRHRMRYRRCGSSTAPKRKLSGIMPPRRVRTPATWTS